MKAQNENFKEIEKILLPNEKEIEFLIKRKKIILDELGENFPTARTFAEERIKNLIKLKKKLYPKRKNDK